MQTQSVNITALHETADLATPEELRRQAAYFAEAFLPRHLLDAMPGLVLVLNRHRQIIFANRAFCGLADHADMAAFAGLFVGDVLACHVAESAATGCGSGEACATCGALTAMLSGAGGEENVQECTLTRRFGAETQNLTLRIWSSPFDYSGERFVILAGMDISHERRRLALERTFFHDILNLVGSIRGLAELLESDGGVDPRQVSRRIQLASQRVIDEIDAQRVLLAVEKGELQIDSHLLSGREILDEVQALYEPQEVARNRRLLIDRDAASVAFVSDPTLLRRILGNMVKNALEASMQGETVTLGCSADGRQITFWVANAAVIPAAYQQRVFQRDFSTKGVGRGLGTYGMRILGHYLAGEVGFVSTPEEGTRFFLRLPLRGGTAGVLEALPGGACRGA